MKPCGNPECCSSTGECERTTHGHGLLSRHGYWQHPCFVCARHFEKITNERHWPHSGESTDPLADEIEQKVCVKCGKKFDCFKKDNWSKCPDCDEGDSLDDFDFS